MKLRFSLLTGLIFLSGMHVATAQTKSSDMTLGLLMPDSSADMNKATITKLGTKIVQMINNSDQVIYGTCNSIVVYPVISIDESGVVSGGMQNITVTTVEISFFIRDLGSKVVYNSITKKLKGSGSNKMQSIANAINQIKPADDIYQKFIADAKTKIVKYYTDNCPTIMHKADNLAAKEDYEQAISMLESVPTSAPCSKDAETKAIAIYKKAMNVICAIYIKRAKEAIAVNDFDAAVEALDVVDPNSNCAPEANKLIAQMSAKVEKINQEQLDLEKRSIDAVKEIGKAYYANTIRVESYDVVVAE
jgi:hypothetical protein